VTTSVIRTERLSRWYGRRVGIDSVDLDLGEGKLYGFLGPNGAGKTTTIRVLLGFLRPTSGQARIFGLDCWRHSSRIKRDVGYLPGDLRLYPWMTGAQTVRMAGRIRGRQLDAWGGELADRFGLPMHLRVRSMSRGMRQKLGLMLALVHRPRLLILDEPTTGLDPPMRIQLAEYLRERARSGDTVFFSSHTLSEVEQLCDHVAVVRDGRIVADQTLASLRDRARRVVSITFRDAIAAQQTAPPSFLEAVQCHGACWQAELVGPTPPLVRWASEQPLDDLCIDRPDLESLFRRLYEDPGGPG
jgi:ABC-2 type transport system ATP-binding protein